MLEAISREAIYLWYYFTLQFEQIFWFWLTGILIGSVVSVFVKSKIHGVFEKMQGKRLGVFGLIPASLIGIASPLCMYGTIPIAASFSEKGIRDDWLAAFMMSSVLLNPQLLIYSAVLGSELLVLRFFSCFLCGITAGLLVRYCCKKKSFFNFEGFSAPANKDVHPNIAIRLLLNIWRNIRATGIYFLIGIALSAIFQRYVPAEFMADLFGSNRAFGILMAATLGVPLYACGGGTIPLLQGWLHQGMSLGSASAFMISGPATKITNLSALKIVLGMKNFMIYILYVIAFAFLAGVITDFFSFA